MKTAVVATLAIIAAVTAACITLYSAFDRYLSDPLTQAQRQQKLAEDAASAAWWASLRADLAPALTALAWGATLTALVVMIVGGVVAMLRYWDGREKMRVVYSADRRGLFPVSPAALDQAALLGLTGYHEAQIERARNPAHELPRDLRTYAPRFGSPKITQRDALAAPDETPQLAPPRARSFSELVQAGVIAPNTGRLLLGMGANDTPMLAAPTEVNGVGLAGLPGSGKSNSMAALAAQLAMLGYRLLVIDPHAHMSDESLTRRLVGLDAALWRHPAVERGDILELLKYVRAEVEARKAGRAGHPWAVIVDEVNDILDDRQLAAIAGPLLVEIARYRKTGIVPIVAGQLWRMKDMDAPVKYVMPTRVVHRLDQAQAVPLLPPGEASDVPRLATGTAKVAVGGQVQTVAVPEITQQDMARMGNWIAQTGWHASAPGYERVRIADVLEGRVVSGGRNDAAAWQSTVRTTPPPAQEPMPPVVEGRGWDADEGDAPDNLIAFPGRKASAEAAVSAVSPISADTTAESLENEAKIAVPEALTPLTGLTEREQQIVALLKQRKTPHEIAVETTGHKGGPTYQARVREVKDLLTRLLP